MAHLTLSANATALLAAIESLSEHLPEIPLEFRQLVLDRLDRFLQVGCVDVETLPTGCAGQLRVEFQPSKAFLEFVVAVRAGQFDALLVDGGSHE